MGGDIDRQNIARFNEAFATILERIGYRSIAKTVRQMEESAYEQWQNTEMKERYFVTLPGKEISWHHRKFLNETFHGGTAQVFRLALKKPGKLEEIAASYELQPGSVRVYKVHSPQYRYA